jgi:hypothetical protein
MDTPLSPCGRGISTDTSTANVIYPLWSTPMVNVNGTSTANCIGTMTDLRNYLVVVANGTNTGDYTAVMIDWLVSPNQRANVNGTSTANCIGTMTDPPV